MVLVVWPAIYYPLFCTQKCFHFIVSPFPYFSFPHFPFLLLGQPLDLVSQDSINYACVVKVRQTPNARAYVASAVPNRTPTTPTNFRIYSTGTTIPACRLYKQGTYKCPPVLYTSSFFSHPHWPYITACCLHASSNVTAGGSQ